MPSIKGKKNNTNIFILVLYDFCKKSIVEEWRKQIGTLFPQKGSSKIMYNTAIWWLCNYTVIEWRAGLN